MKIKPPWYYLPVKLAMYVSKFMFYSIVTLITVIVLSIYLSPSPKPVEDIKSIQYKGTSTGIITSAEPHTGMKQNQYGTRITTDYFIVTYQYQVGDSVYNGSDQVRNTPVLAREMEGLRENEFRDSVVVRYDKKEVQSSVVEL